MIQVLKVEKANKREWEDEGTIQADHFLAAIGDFDWLIYSYAQGSYDGSGDCIWKKDGKFYHHDLGHCSCYGPLEDIKTEQGFASIEDLLKNSSSGIAEHIAPLLDRMKMNGLK